MDEFMEDSDMLDVGQRSQSKAFLLRCHNRHYDHFIVESVFRTTLAHLRPRPPDLTLDLEPPDQADLFWSPRISPSKPDKTRGNAEQVEDLVCTIATQ